MGARLAKAAIVLALVATALTVAAAPGAADTTATTNDRNISKPTAWWTYTNVTEAQVSTYLRTNGARLTDIEIYNPGTSRFTVTMVKNTGSYAVSSWWWYYGLTANGVANKLTLHSGRLVDLDPYVVNGGVRYAVIIVPNSGPTARAWSYFTSTTSSNLGSYVSSSGHRLIDLDTYTLNGVKRYTAVLVANSGDDANTWWWYINQTTAGVSNLISSKGARIVDLDRQDDGTWNVVMVKNVAPDAASWWWYTNFTSLGAAVDRANQLGARIVDIETYLNSSGSRRYAAVLIDNSNAETRRVRAKFGSYFNDASGNPKGIYEAYLKSMTSGALVTLNQNKATEVASTLKVLHLLHALQQVANGDDTLNTSDVDVYWYGMGSVSGANNVCPDPTLDDNTSDPHSTQTLRTTLNQMIRSSNNASTRAIVLRYRPVTSGSGQYTPFNTTAAANNMESTQLRNDIGCGLKDGGNLTTADDLSTVYERVHKGLTLDDTRRTEFWNTYQSTLGANNTSEVAAKIAAIVDKEAALLGKSTSVATSFKQQVQFAAKRGGYGVCRAGTGGSGQPACDRRVIRTYSGRLILPAKSSGSTVQRAYTFGSILSDYPTTCWGCATETSIINNAVDATGEIFRTVIRDALKTW
jgi:hypothetical protein